MIRYERVYKIRPQWRDRGWVLEKAQEAIKAPVLHITDIKSPGSGGGIHDYYSNGDYWWPDPDTPDGLPYIHRDGQTNPENFNGHRNILRQMRTNVVFLTSAYVLTGEKACAERAVRHLKEFFLDEETCMAPHLQYAQAIPGICSGRGIGIIGHPPSGGCGLCHRAFENLRGNDVGDLRWPEKMVLPLPWLDADRPQWDPGDEQGQ